MDINKLNCATCKHKVECENHNGKERDDGDDYRALIGTHHCLASWSNSSVITDTQGGD